MAKYAILRTKKLTSWGSIAGSAKHTYREQTTLNADESKKELNLHYGAKSSKELLARFREAMPEKVRKNAVLGIEYLITCSPERFDDPDFDHVKYFNDAISFLREKHGPGTVLAFSGHYDETTPHLIAYVIPKKDGKLNCRHFLGGRAKMSALQTDFANKVAKKHGLQRGVKGSKAKHKTIRQFYAELNKASVAHIQNKPSKRDDLLALFGFKTKRKRLYEESIANIAAAELESRLDALRAADRAKHEIDTAEQAYERFKLSLKLDLEKENAKTDELRRKYRAEYEEYHDKKAGLEYELELLAKTREELKDLPSQLESADRLNKLLSDELQNVNRRLERYERKYGSSQDYNSQFRR